MHLTLKCIQLNNIVIFSIIHTLKNCKEIRNRKRPTRLNSQQSNRDFLSERLIFANQQANQRMNKKPKGLNAHLRSIYFTLTSCQRGSYFIIKGYRMIYLTRTVLFRTNTPTGLNIGYSIQMKYPFTIRYKNIYQM